jgi:hypothetical protein
MGAQTKIGPPQLPRNKNRSPQTLHTDPRQGHRGRFTPPATARVGTQKRCDPTRPFCIAARVNYLAACAYIESYALVDVKCA